MPPAPKPIYARQPTGPQQGISGTTIIYCIVIVFIAIILAIVAAVLWFFYQTSPKPDLASIRKTPVYNLLYPGASLIHEVDTAPLCFHIPTGDYDPYTCHYSIKRFYGVTHLPANIASAQLVTQWYETAYKNKGWWDAGSDGLHGIDPATHDIVGLGELADIKMGSPGPENYPEQVGPFSATVEIYTSDRMIDVGAFSDASKYLSTYSMIYSVEIDGTS